MERILTSSNPTFNTSPNAFLAEMIKGVKPGRSLDVGMGQGRNTIYLAQQGWDSVGFDPADRARRRCERAGQGAWRHDHHIGRRRGNSSTGAARSGISSCSAMWGRGSSCRKSRGRSVPEAW